MYEYKTELKTWIILSLINGRKIAIDSSKIFVIEETSEEGISEVHIQYGNSTTYYVVQIAVKDIIDLICGKEVK